MTASLAGGGSSVAAMIDGLERRVQDAGVRRSLSLMVSVFVGTAHDLLATPGDATDC